MFLYPISFLRQEYVPFFFLEFLFMYIERFPKTVRNASSLLKASISMYMPDLHITTTFPPEIIVKIPKHENRILRSRILRLRRVAKRQIPFRRSAIHAERFFAS